MTRQEPENQKPIVMQDSHSKLLSFCTNKPSIYPSYSRTRVSTPVPEARQDDDMIMSSLSGDESDNADVTDGVSSGDERQVIIHFCPNSNHQTFS
jgi:hypothetical protein